MPQQTSTFESHFFFTHMQGVAGAYHKLIVYSWVPILQVGGLGKVKVNCFPKAITTRLGWESNPRPPDPESDATDFTTQFVVGSKTDLRDVDDKETLVALIHDNNAFHVFYPSMFRNCYCRFLCSRDKNKVINYFT